MSDGCNHFNNNVLKKIENNIQEIKALHENINKKYSEYNIYGILNLSITFYEKSLEFIALSKHVFQHQIIQINTEQAKNIKKNMNLLNDIINNLRNKRDKWLQGSTFMQDFNFAQIIDNGEERLQIIEAKVCYFLKIIVLAEKKEAENQQPKMTRYKLH